jgi:fluoroacetyl-CoA thioesterase
MKRPAGSKSLNKRKRSPHERKSRASTQKISEQRPRLGLESAFERIVPDGWTLAAYDPRLPAVFSTPAMIGMMEIAASQAVLPELAPGEITVGTRIEVDHLKAVPAGTRVRATARLVEHEGRFLVFDVTAKAGEQLIGRGRVYRAIVEPEKFQAKAHSRAS